MQQDIIPDDVKIEIYNSFCGIVYNMDITREDYQKINFINNTIEERFCFIKSWQPVADEVNKVYLRIKKLERICK